MSNVAEQLADAWKAVEESGVPEHLHETALKFALGIVGTRPSQGGQHDPAHIAGRTPRQPDETGNAGSLDGDYLAEFCRKIGREVSDAEQVIHIAGDGTFSVVATPKALAKGTRIKSAQRVMCLYVAYQRYINEKKEISVEDVRPILSSVDLLDAKNFKSKHVKSVPGVKLNGEKFIPVTNLATSAGVALDELVAAENNA